MKYLRLLRVDHYVKNLFVFAPIFFSLNFYSIELIEKSIIAFVLFCLTSSSVYIINDLLDFKEDILHPVKKNRPIASGLIDKQEAILLATLLITISSAISYLFSTDLLMILLLYFGLNLIYSFKLKEIPILDVFLIATGFVLRIYAGATAIQVPTTMWIILVTFLLSLFMAFGKRRDDLILVDNKTTSRKSIVGYNLEFINSAMTLMAGVVIISYIFYTVSPEVEDKFNTHNLYFTVSFVILGILRYLQLTFVENNSGNPTKILLKDSFLQITIVLWLLSFLIIVS